MRVPFDDARIAVQSRTSFTPDWGDATEYARRFVRRVYPSFAGEADDLAQDVMSGIQPRSEAGALRLDHGEASLYDYVKTATRNACISLAEQIERRLSEVLEGDPPTKERSFERVEWVSSVDCAERLPIECPLCVGRSRSCGPGDEDPSMVRGIASAACFRLVLTGDPAALAPGRVDAFLRRVGAEAGILPPEAVDKSTRAGTRITRNLSTCTPTGSSKRSCPSRSCRAS